jgi:hypothetical protein
MDSQAHLGLTFNFAALERASTGLQLCAAQLF